MARTFLGAIAACGLLAALSVAGPAHAAVPSTICQLERQVQIDPSTFQSTISKPDETYQFKDGKLFITASDRPEYIYGRVEEVEFRRRYVSRDKVFVFTLERTGKQRMLMFHNDQRDIRVGEFFCDPRS